MNLIIQPDAGVVAVVQAINKAKQRVDIAIFRSDRKEIVKALAAAVQRGAHVRVLVAHTNRGGENRLRKLEQRFLEVGITVTRTGDDFLRYHGKYLLVDQTLHVYAFNFTTADMGKSRSFGVSTRDAAAVREAVALFEADCTRQPYMPKRSPLVISPETAREQLMTFIKAARRQLLLYDVNIQDPACVKLLKQRAAAGVEVRVIGKVKQLKGSDPIDVRPLRTMRLHARVIVRDGSRAFVGSQSLRRPELDQRREVGLLISNVSVARKLQAVFEQDWVDSAPRKEAVDELVSKTDEKDKKADDKEREKEKEEVEARNGPALVRSRKSA
jgi:phosphatidylserine/phosphatidylglycerophosphate/cardiolipin synthase-like enzyme